MDAHTPISRRPASTRPEDWGVRWQPRPGAALRLFCLPHSGGGAGPYHSWGARLGPEIEVVAIRLPGREARYRERPISRLDELVPALVRALAPWLDRPHAWFGHSMGALIGYEVCRELRRCGLPEPVRLLASGRRAPHLPARSRPVHDAPVADVVAYLKGLDGTPAELLDNPSALSMLLPTMRADLAVSERYRWQPGPPLDCPVSVLGGTADPVATTGELHAWQLHTSAGCTVRMFDGGHFFLHDDPAPVLRAIAEELSPVSTAPRWRPLG
ncbi:thioesterase II family protein [Kitasatospora sp. NPDC056531]|uniref:thioesterase II family protein n=1 Tax=Kitasatospora sp. NPDC056531 TaxID=3345856 RepID=UPI00368207D8